MLCKPKGYKLYRPNIMVGTDNTMYLGITFCETLKDDKDMIRQMRILYAKSNKLLRIFSNCTTDVKLVLFDSYCTSLYCLFLWTSANLEWHSTTHIERYLICLYGVVQVQSMLKTTSVTLKQC